MQISTINTNQMKVLYFESSGFTTEELNAATHLVAKIENLVFNLTPENDNKPMSCLVLEVNGDSTKRLRLFLLSLVNTGGSVSLKEFDILKSRIYDSDGPHAHSVSEELNVWVEHIISTYFAKCSTYGCILC